MGLERNRPARARSGKRGGRSAGSLLLVAGSLIASCALATPAAAADVKIDNLSLKSSDGDTFTYAHVEFDGTNLTKDEIVKLLSPDVSSDDEHALALKLKADKILIPSLDIDGKDKSKIHLSGLSVDHVDSGKIGALDLASIAATGPENGGTVTVKCGALHLDGLDAAPLFADASTPSASPAHLAGLTWSGIDVATPDFEGDPGQTIHFTLGAIDIHNDYAGDVLKRSLTKITGIVFEPSAGSDAGKAIASLGYSKLELSLTTTASYDAAAKSLTIDDFTINGAQMGSIGLKAGFTNVAPSLFSADKAAATQAVLEAGVASMELKLVNAGLFDKGLAYIAKQEGVAVDDLRKQWSTMAGTIAPVMLGGDPGGLLLGSETQKFIADPKSLWIAIKAKNGALKAGDFMTIGDDPETFAGKLDISAAANR